MNEISSCQTAPMAAWLCLAIFASMVSPGCSVVQEEQLLAAPLFIMSRRSDANIDEATRNRVLRFRFVDVAPEFLLAQAHTDAASKMRKLAVNLFDDTVILAVRESLELRSETKFTWVGKIEGMDGSHVVFVVEDRVVIGNIKLGRDFYWLRSIGNGSHVVYQINQQAFPSEASPMVRQNR